MIMAKLVIVDDEPNVLNALRRICLNHDAPPAISNPQLMSFTSPVKALEYLQDHLVDLIISDFRMPEMDGATFLNEARKLQANSARIIISAHADIEGILRAINDAGIFRFVSKPWSEHELKAAIVQVLAHRALLVENLKLANEVRQQRGVISEQQAELESLELESPGITQVGWAEDGSVLIED
jgi:response regulator RpfG family c-di-GMP phosphodiesterase